MKSRTLNTAWYFNTMPIFNSDYMMEKAKNWQMFHFRWLVLHFKLISLSFFIVILYIIIFHFPLFDLLGHGVICNRFYKTKCAMMLLQAFTEQCICIIKLLMAGYVICSQYLWHFQVEKGPINMWNIQDIDIVRSMFSN